MNRKLVSLFLAIALALCVTAVCAEGTSVTVTDMMGRTVTLSAPASRVVALTAADCEILCAIGAGDKLAGRGEYCDYPAEILALPAISSGAQTNVEEIIALQPDLVLMGSMAQSKEGVEALEAAGIRVAVSEAADIAGVYTAITIIGDLMGKQPEAAALIADMQTTFDQIAAASADTGKTVYFEVSPLQWGLWTAGRGTFMDELAAMCGLTNAFADVEGWAQISEEQVLARDPDYIVTITMYYGEGPTPVEEIMGREGWGALKAIVNGHVLNADSNEISRPGPRLKDAAVTLWQFVTEAEAAAPAA